MSGLVLSSAGLPAALTDVPVNVRMKFLEFFTRAGGNVWVPGPCGPLLNPHHPAYDPRSDEVSLDVARILI